MKHVPPITDAVFRLDFDFECFEPVGSRFAKFSWRRSFFRASSALSRVVVSYTFDHE